MQSAVHHEAVHPRRLAVVNPPASPCAATRGLHVLCLVSTGAAADRTFGTLEQVGENQYYTTTNNLTKTIDTHDKQKDLGVTFDSKLTFDEHISQVVNKATKITKIIRRTFQFLDKHTFLTPYKTMVRSHLDYAMAVWHPPNIR